MDVYTTAFSYPAPHSPTPAHIPKDPLSVPPQTGGTSSGTLATSTPRTAPAAFPAVPLPNVPEAPPASADCTPPKSPQKVEREWEAVQKLASDITAREGCLVTVTRESTDSMAESSTVSDPPATIWNFHLSGVSNAVLSARGSILRDVPQDNRITVKVPRSDILEASQHVLKQEVVRRLGVIAIDSKAFISVVSYDNSSNEGQKVLATASEDGVKTLESENGKAGYDKSSGRMDNGSAALEEIGYKFIVTGPMESVHIAKVRLLVMIDELSGLHAEICDIDYKLHNIIAGRKRAYIQQIQEETGTNIYLPTSLFGMAHPGLSIHGGEQGKLGKANQIWISGEFFGVQRARDMLLNIAMQKCKLIISRDAAILPRKLDWLLTGKKIDEVRTIMNDNGTYVQVPCVGGQTSMISVFGDHRANIERTIRSIMALACQFYVASLWLLPPPVEVGPRVVLNPAQIQPIVKHISHVTGAEVVYKPNMFEVNGLERQVTSAMLLLMDVDVLHNFVPEVRFRVELANEQREFFSGKKNGKINKIMKMTNAKIRFETLNDYNFLIDIAGKNQDALQGLSLIQEELPAEISFYVPESYHKRIIGVGGKNIQKIMKIYNSFVKFSNAEEFASLGGYFDNEDNVYAKTPSKNGANLWELKQAIMEVVGLKERNFYTDYVSIPRPYHRTLLGEKSIFIHDIEQKTNTVVRFPYSETGSDVVSIFGPATEVPLAATLLLELVPFDVSTTHVARQAVQLEQTESLFGKMTLDSDTNGANGAGSKGLPVPPLSFHQDRRIEELWPIVNPVSQRPAPTRTESDHQKRESDPVINDRIRQASTGHVPAGSHSGALPPHRHHSHSQSRINANRHQSLDISQLNFSRALSGGKSSPFGMMPGSPPILDSSPNTATGGFMPRAPSPPGRL
ncbi:hypothetical protein I350_01175 [Cryptococcus amylolentus CBS 6273]|uniref:K Homology domain-containing protein n=1 Tax=Cryptococcus amylolentus CBS 6273 TaxID=1296118 RepID=A0A1E3KBV7_9TREE|nr:hypothetical protein I350_01175 [Cryptococcus amylolentus CBS 6273]